MNPRQNAAHISLTKDQIDLLRTEVDRRGRVVIEKAIASLNVSLQPRQARDAARRFIYRALHPDPKQRKAMSRANFDYLANALDFTPDSLSDLLGIRLTETTDAQRVLVSRSRGRMLSVASGMGIKGDEYTQLEQYDYEALPVPLNLAITQLYGIWQIARAENPKANHLPVNPHDRERLYMIRTENTHAQFKDEQQAIADACSPLWRRIRPSGSDDFGLTVSADVGLYYQELYCFPFTLSRTRLPCFSVLPYARQKKLGVVLHKDNFNILADPDGSYFTDLTARDGKDGRPPIAGLWETDTFVKEALVQMILPTLQSPEGRVYSVTGDAMFPILSEALIVDEGNLSNEVINRLPERNRKVSRPLVDDDFRKEVHKEASVSVQTPSDLRRCFNAQELEKTKTSIFVWDPWEASKLDLANTDFRAIIFPHGLEVPVGVGFSVNLMPALLCKDGDESRWKKIWQSAYQAYAKDGGGKLKEIGIELFSEEEFQAIEAAETIAHKQQTRHARRSIRKSPKVDVPTPIKERSLPSPDLLRQPQRMKEASGQTAPGRRRVAKSR